MTSRSHAPSLTEGEPGGFSVLHVDTERTWRGGQQQAAWLLEGMLARGLKTALVCPPGSVLEERSRARGWPVHSVGMRGEWDVAAGRKIAGTARAGGFGILHLHSGHALALGLWARLFHRRLKLVASRRVDFPIRGRVLGLLKYGTGLLDRIVCVSEAVREVLIAGGIPRRKIVVIRSGVDTRRFESVHPPPEFRRGLGIPNGHLVAGTVAALSDDKDYPTLLRAARRVLNLNPGVTFIAVGDGPRRAELSALASALELDRRFLFAGFREDVGNFLKLFDVFILASKIEGLGTSLLDAQAVGLPVAACRAGGIPEIVRDRENGLLFPPGDAAALAASVLELLANPDLRRALGERAKKTVREFDVSRTIAEHLQLYREL